MINNVTCCNSTEVASAQLIVFTLVSLTSTILAFAILIIVIATILDRYRKTYDRERGPDYSVYVLQGSENTRSTHSPPQIPLRRLGSGYEDMTLNQHDNIYETID
nr:protein m135 [Mastomys natalensis cytomegalovirus 3]WEG69951.1 protein m135 [Mastomys natalensis cytomegalovirus 3]WEG70091.1 protein m135 [Mastomys natalensis cytomegalovirus 3]WEG70231.1 protein m135 [Mastomys natalensis cytomegalovirus 3]WEG70371.1 protein m135 [Mastomys natalensis cytomegalovirus 3]